MKIEISAKVYFLLILVLSALILWPLFLPGFFFHHDDLQVMRIFEMRKCFNDLQLPCRWVPDMGYGNGFPLFNYYSAIPYYIGAALSYVLGYVISAKALFFIPLILGGAGMFILANKLFGKEAGFLAGILYAFAPYRALDSYVRGAVAESFALSLIPFVFYFVVETIEKPTRKNIIWGSFFFSGFLLSHNIMTMFFTPFLLLWVLIFLYINKWKNWKSILLSLILGIGLSAFFLLPVFLEKNLVQTENLIRDGSDFRTHFVTVYQLFLDRFWGYGGSQFGPNDTISFQIGWPLWWFVLTSIPLIFIYLKKNLKFLYIGIFLLFMFLVSIFMQHNKSTFIWEMIGPLQYAQFPWRFLSLSIFSCSLLAGFSVQAVNAKWRGLAVWIVAVFAIFMNWSYFQPREFYPWITDQIKLSDPLWEIQQKAGILDYLPKTAYEPHGRAPNNLELLEGNAKGSNYQVTSNSFSIDINASEKSFVQVPVFDFPNWIVYSNGKEIDHTNKSDLGRIAFYLEPGQYKITGKFTDTPVRIIGNTLSLLSFGFVIFILLNKKFMERLK